jgi:hypothetical protein
LEQQRVQLQGTAETKPRQRWISEQAVCKGINTTATATGCRLLLDAASTYSSTLG